MISSLKGRILFLPIFSYPEVCVNYYIEGVMLLDICCLESRVAGMNLDLITCKLAEGSMKRRTTQCFSTLPSLDNLLSVLVSF